MGGLIVNQHHNYFYRFKDALANQVCLANRDAQKKISFYTDASDYGWSAMAQQAPMSDLRNHHRDQRHKSLDFLSGRFSKAQQRWPTIQKDSYVVVASLDRLHYLSATLGGFYLYRDPNNLIYLFDPLSEVSYLGHTSLRKFLWWAVKQSEYNYTWFHISGDDKIWFDLLIRCQSYPTIRILVTIPTLPISTSTDFVWYSSDDTYMSQQHH